MRQDIRITAERTLFQRDETFFFKRGYFSLFGENLKKIFTKVLFKNFQFYKQIDLLGKELGCYFFFGFHSWVIF